MKALSKANESDYFIWIKKDKYYESNIWNLKNHKYYNDMTTRQKEKIIGNGSIDFTLCACKRIREEIKNACAYLIEYKIIALHSFFHDKFVIDNIIKFFNIHSMSISILEFDKEKLIEEYEQYLSSKGIKTKIIARRVSGNMNVVEYIEKNKTVNFIWRIFEINEAALNGDIKEQEKDSWDIRNLDISVTGFNSARPRYTICFKRIYQPKIREVVKKYEYERLKTSKYSTIIDDLKVINLFSKFLYEKYPAVDSLDKLTREIVLEFLGYIETLDMVPTTKGQRKGCLRVFLNLVILYGWENTPKERLLYKSDYGKKIYLLPKPIESSVIKKLNENLKFLPIHMKRMVVVVENIGMRVNELCQLKTGCVKKDAEGDYFLEYYQSKTYRISRIPITKEIAEIILEQESETLSSFKDSKYIFTRNGVKPVSQETFSYHINKLAFEHDIRDVNGNLYRFKAHHFRHTVATKYVNNGMNPNMIRMMLGHSKIKSIMSYIDLRDMTIIKAMEEILNEQNNIIGNLDENYTLSTVDEVELIHGKCMKPEGTGVCENVTKCYECSMFCFCNDDADQFKAYVSRLDEHIEYSKENGFERMQEVNEKMKSSIEKLLEKNN
ncbi:tyrosine-type recombinase/integrase [Clostridium butyricum]|uniref:tyrosine-type recombinase/integrase n=1 Tax=Clostridium butyricum TaxID=1492 RepID=UPI0024BAB115|nr:tyrosine-type recombinase/integrase [Clostridium butyricum]